MPRHIGTCFRFYTQMRVEKKNKAFAYRVPIGDYNYLQCNVCFNDDKSAKVILKHFQSTIPTPRPANPS